MRREVIVSIIDEKTGKQIKLTKEERKNFAKENPGYRLCFRLRFPDLPLYLSAISAVIWIIALTVYAGIIIRIVL